MFSCHYDLLARQGTSVELNTDLPIETFEIIVVVEELQLFVSGRAGKVRYQ